MKKIYTSAALAFITATAFAQTGFWTATNYRGAFAPAPTAMWTDSWTEWDPQNKVYPAPTVTVSADITSNTTWTAGNTYLISAQVFVKNGATLTIQPGTVIMGDKAATGAGLFITKGAKLMAEGTVSMPIVFTSNQPVGARAAGDWGGIILLGKGPNNNAGGLSNVEGLAPTTDTEFGGGTTPDAHDNSGSLKYVRIEFGGYVYATNKEINNLTFGAVGDGTTIDYVQASFGNDDAFEWFGGTVNCTHLVSYRNLDDDFDTDNGFAGHVQFGLSLRDPNIADAPAISTSEGFESDNDPNGTTATPQTAAVFSNMTLVGPLRGVSSATVAAGYKRGARIRRNSAESILNSIFMDHLNGVMIDGTASEANATAGSLEFAHNIVAGNRPGMVTEVTSTSTFNIKSWFAASNNDSLLSTSGILIDPYATTGSAYTGDYRPAASSPALTGADFSSSKFQGGFVGIEENSILSGVVLYPNPASKASNLSIAMAKTSSVSVKVYNVTGTLVAEVMNNETLAAGTHTVAINTANLNSGIYFVSIETLAGKQVQKLIVNN